MSQCRHHRIPPLLAQRGQLRSWFHHCRTQDVVFMAAPHSRIRLQPAKRSAGPRLGQVSLSDCLNALGMPIRENWHNPSIPPFLRASRPSDGIRFLKSVQPIHVGSASRVSRNVLTCLKLQPPGQRYRPAGGGVNDLHRLLAQTFRCNAERSASMPPRWDARSDSMPFLTQPAPISAQ